MNALIERLDTIIELLKAQQGPPEPKEQTLMDMLAYDLCINYDLPNRLHNALITNSSTHKDLTVREVYVQGNRMRGMGKKTWGEFRDFVDHLEHPDKPVASYLKPGDRLIYQTPKHYENKIGDGDLYNVIDKGDKQLGLEWDKAGSVHGIEPGMDLSDYRFATKEEIEILGGMYG